MNTTRDQVSYGYVLQYWVESPSPPDATGWKSEFAWQLARRQPPIHQGHTAAERGENDAPPQLQFIVVEGLQYAVLAK